MVGGAGFFSGASARVLAHAPSTAASWSVYELAKWLLRAPAAPTPDQLPPSLQAKLESSP